MMAYFSNGTEGMDYESEYCDKCVHNHPEHGCPCLAAHDYWNYEECNKADSILHKMIPRSEDKLTNEQCIFFKEPATNTKPFGRRLTFGDQEQINALKEMNEGGE